MRKPTILATSVVVGLTCAHGVFGSPAGAAEREVVRDDLTMAWPAVDEATPMASIALAEPGNYGVKGGNIEFEWKVEEGES